MTEVFLQYGLFLAQAVTIVAAIIVVALVIVVLGKRDGGAVERRRK